MLELRVKIEVRDTETSQVHETSAYGIAVPGGSRLVMTEIFEVFEPSVRSLIKLFHLERKVASMYLGGKVMRGEKIDKEKVEESG